MSNTKSTKKFEIKTMENIKPKIDHNITLAGLLLTDADTVVDKVKRATKGVFKGLLVFEKEIPTGKVYILNGAEFPNADAVDLLLYLLWHAEQNNWKKILEFKSLNKIVKEVFGTKKLGNQDRKKLERLLTIWKFHAFYFPKSFLWQGEIITAQFGVINDWQIKSEGRGKPARLVIEFNQKFLEICKNTDWYRRPNWLEIRKLRKEIAKRLYMLALEYKPNEKAKEWKIYIGRDLKHWYRNALNSLANPEYLWPSVILKRRLKPAVKEISKETNCKMKLQQTEEGNYCITVEEIAPAGTDTLEIPFDRLSNDEKTILITYVEAVAPEKGINNIWGFLRSMTSKQIKSWLSKAKKYLETEAEKAKETKLVEKTRLLEILQEWGKKKLEGKEVLFNTYFGNDKLLKAYESNKRVVFVCVDKILADLLTQKFKEELKEVFGKEVEFAVE